MHDRIIFIVKYDVQERLPAGIAGLQRLRRLDLSDNNCLQEIPDEVGALHATVWSNISPGFSEIVEGVWSSVRSRSVRQLQQLQQLPR